MESSVQCDPNSEAGASATADTAVVLDGELGANSVADTASTMSSQMSYMPQQTLSTVQQLLSPLQFLHAPSAAGTAAAVSLPWMMPSPYQMMMLPASGVPQPLFLPPGGSGGVLTMQDGQMFVAPLPEATATNSPLPSDTSSSSTAAAGQQFAAVPAIPPPVTASPAAGGAQQLADSRAADGLKPPKKPLTPYMIFSKRIWPQVKAEHAHLSSVCEIGAVVGSLWRDLDPSEKQKYNELYAKDKERYDEELRNYLKQTGLLASDLVKMRAKRPSSNHAHRPPPAQAQSQNGARDPAVQLSGWPNGGIYANHGGSVAVSTQLAAQAYNIGQAGALSSSRPWQLNEPIQTASSAGNGMVVYQLPMTAGAQQSDGTLSQGQPHCNGTLPDYNTARAWNQLSASAGNEAGSSSDSQRIGQLEAEVLHLRTALSDKTREVQHLRQELKATLELIEEQQRIRQEKTGGPPTPVAGGETVHAADIKDSVE